MAEEFARVKLYFEKGSLRPKEIQEILDQLAVELAIPDFRLHAMRRKLVSA